MVGGVVEQRRHQGVAAASSCRSPPMSQPRCTLCTGQRRLQLRLSAVERMGAAAAASAVKQPQTQLVVAVAVLQAPVLPAAAGAGQVKSRRARWLWH